ncbi:MAG: TldD/PmbA family protein [Candidatus Bipolaricaulota bacterium]
MIHEARQVLTQMPVDYADVRLEEDRRVTVSLRTRALREATEYSVSGGHVRAYAHGGKAVGTFTSPDRGSAVAASTAASAARAGERRDAPLRLAPAPALSGVFPVAPVQDPRTIALADKVDLARHYNDILLQERSVVATEVEYDEFSARRTFANSEGTAIEYELLNVTLYGLIVTQRNGVVQRVRFAYGGNESFHRLLGREDELRATLEVAKELPLAEPARAGIFPVILDPSEASVFIHEAFGHLSEADGLQGNPAFRDRLKLGVVLGGSHLSVVDDPLLPNLPGSYAVDDEGVAATRTDLIRSGVLAGRMHSRETAAEFGEPLSGNMRAVGATFTPLVRMSNIYIEPGTSTFEDMVASIDRGYYLVGAKGGQTAGDQFSFGALWGRRIDGGRLGNLVRDINMSGELFSTLGAISLIGNDLAFSERGGCGKGAPMQTNRKSGKGAPHIKIDRVTVGGI